MFIQCSCADPACSTTRLPQAHRDHAASAHRPRASVTKCVWRGLAGAWADAIGRCHHTLNNPPRFPASTAARPCGRSRETSFQSRSRKAEGSRAVKRIVEDFFEQDPLTCARELIGCHFHWNGCIGRILETEAYDSEDDPACHTWFRPSTRAGAGERHRWRSSWHAFPARRRLRVSSEVNPWKPSQARASESPARPTCTGASAIPHRPR